MNRHYFEYIERKAESQTCLMLRTKAVEHVSKIVSLTGTDEKLIKAHILELSDRDEAKPIDFFVSYYNSSLIVLNEIVYSMTGEV